MQIRKFHPREDAEWDDWPDEPEESIEIQPSSNQPAEKEASVESAVPIQPTPVQINAPEVWTPHPAHNNESRKKSSSSEMDEEFRCMICVYTPLLPFSKTIFR